MADTERHFASPPCFMHEIDSTYSGVGHAQTQQAIDVARWRNAERERLVGLCKSLPRQYQREASRSVSSSVKLLISEMQKGPVCFFWPLDGQINLISLMEQISTTPLGAAFPRKICDHKVFSCSKWNVGDSLFIDEGKIPVYCDGELVSPKVLIVPVVAFDNDRFFIGDVDEIYQSFIRKSYPKPYLIGVGYNFQNIRTIYPQDHDVQLDIIFTELGPICWG